MIVWINKALAFAIHERQLAEHGGSSGVRDAGMLDSALARPQQRFAYGDPPPDLAELAAALAFGLARNHPFVDGNKRIAFASADVFLRINGWRLQRAPMQIHAEMIQMLESGTVDIAHLDPWLRGFAVQGT